MQTLTHPSPDLHDRTNSTESRQGNPPHAHPSETVLAQITGPTHGPKTPGKTLKAKPGGAIVKKVNKPAAPAKKSKSASKAK